MNIPASQRCASQNRRGEPCKAKVVTRDEHGRPACAMHGGLSNARQMGRAGGLVRQETPIRRELKDDELIREQARDVLKRGLAGDSSISKMMLDSARSVFSFRAASPPDEPRVDHRDSVTTLHGRPVTNLADVLELAVERTPSLFSQDAERWAAIAERILRAADRNGTQATSTKGEPR